MAGETEMFTLESMCLFLECTWWGVGRRLRCAQMDANLPKNEKGKTTGEIGDWRLVGRWTPVWAAQTAQVWSTLVLFVCSLLMEGWQQVASCVKPSLDLQLLSCLVLPKAKSLIIKARPKDCTLFSCVLTATFEFCSHLLWQKVSIACVCESHQHHRQ